MFGARARARSTETNLPWPPAPALGRSLAYPVGVMIAIAYGSLIPFTFDPRTLLASGFTGSLSWYVPSLDDALVNLFLYLPLGLLLAAYAGRRLRSYVIAFLISTLACTGLSFSIEWLQGGIVERVSSWFDVCLNGLGGLIGAAIGTFCRSTDGQASVFKKASGALTQSRNLLIGLYAGLFFFGLAPFHFVTNSAALHESFRRARWNLTQPRAVGLMDAPLATLSHELTGAAWFVVVGALAVYDSRARGRRDAAAMVSAIKQGAIVAGLIETMQLFTFDHTFDAASLVLRVLATVFGAWMGFFFLDRVSRRGPHDLRRRKIAGAGLLIVVILQMALLMMASLKTRTFSIEALLGCRISCVPFEGLWLASTNQAITKLLGLGVTAAALAITLLFLGRSDDSRRAPILSVCGTVAILFVMEVVRAVGVGGGVDVTGTIVGGCVAIIVNDLLRAAPTIPSSNESRFRQAVR